MNIPNRSIHIYFSSYKLLVASGPYLKNTTNYSPAMTFSFTPDAKLINVKIPTLSRAKFVQKIQAVL
jgi:hypothetical protein